MQERRTRSLRLVEGTTPTRNSSKDLSRGSNSDLQQSRIPPSGNVFQLRQKPVASPRVFINGHEIPDWFIDNGVT